MHVVVATDDDIGKCDSTNGYVSAAFMANSPVSWWVGTGATRHFVLIRYVLLLSRAQMVDPY